MAELIQGKIIRILDKRTVIINLGKDQGIASDSIFSIRGMPEEIIDPETNEVLGKLSIIKTKVKASQVYPKFTVATTKWNVVAPNLGAFGEAMGSLFATKVVDQGELAVADDQIQPWNVKYEQPVKVGDIVEVYIEINDKKITPPRDLKLLTNSESGSSLEQDNADDSTGL